MATIMTSDAEAGKTCPYCRFPLKSGSQAVRCDACGTVHHDECWQEGGGCTVLGCRNAGLAVAATAAVMHPEAGAPMAASAGPARGSRNLAIGIIAGLLIAAAGIGSFLALRSSRGAAAPPTTTVQTVQVTTQQQPTSPSTATANAEAAAARTLAAIVRFSENGRAAVRSGNYGAAIANRQETLTRLDDLTGGSARLQRAKRSFQRAIAASLRSDEAYASGGDASQSDAAATQLKRRFVTQFNPIARRYGLETFSADGI
jgi:hypothetical protein